MLERAGQAADRHADAELLSVAAVPAFVVGEVEIGFGVFDEADEAFDGAIAGAEADLARGAFLDRDAQVALAGDRGRDGSHAHFLEELRVAEAGLGDAGAGKVEDLAGPERKLAGDDGGTRLGVALDLHGADGVAFAFLNLERHVDRTRGQIRLTDDLDEGVDVAHLSVIFLELLGGGLDRRDGEGFAARDLVELGGVGAAAQRRLGDDLAQRVGRVGRVGGAEAVAFERDGPDLVEAAFLDLEDHVDPTGPVLHVLDFADLGRVGVLDFDVKVALRTIELAELLAVGAILFGVETTPADQPGPLVPAVFAGLEIGGGPEVVALESGGAFEAEIIHLELDAFVHDDRDDLAARSGTELGGDAGERTLLTEFVLQLDLGTTELGHVDRLADLDVLDLGAAEPAGLADESVAADVLDAFQDRAGLDGDDDVDLPGLRVEDRLDDGLVETTGGVEGSDRAGDGILAERLSLAQGDEAEHELLGDGGAVRLDPDGADDGLLRRRCGLGCADERRQGEGEAGGAKPAAAEGGVIHYYGILWPETRSVSAPD